MNTISIYTTSIFRFFTLQCCLFLIGTTMAWGQNYSGGDGSAQNPFQIANEADLKTLATAVNGTGGYNSNQFFIQTADITLTSEWISIGNNSKYFQGTYDGNGKKISGMTISTAPISSGFYYTGLFGNLSGTVKNLTLIAPEITFTTGLSPYVGFITGHLSSNSDVAISNCHVEGGKMSVIVTSREFIYAGGMVGYSRYGGKIMNCSCTKSSLRGFSNHNNWNGSQMYIGGIAGSGSLALESCKFRGEIVALGTETSIYAGGITGNIGGINKCTAQGIVRAISTQNSYINVGGISGSGSNIKNCISLCTEITGLSTSSSSMGRITTSSSSLENNQATPFMKKLKYDTTSDLAALFTSLDDMTDENIARCSTSEDIVSSATGTDGEDLHFGCAENVFVNSLQGTGKGDDASNPAVVGNKLVWKMCGTYDKAAKGYPVTLLSGEGGTTDTLSLYTNNWVLQKENENYTHLDGQAPMLWNTDIQDTAICIVLTEDATFAKPVAFGPDMRMIIESGKTLTLPASADSSYSLPVINLSDTTASISITNPKALYSVEQLTVTATFPAKDTESEQKKLYANISMPFEYSGTLTGLDSYCTYNAANRADKGTAGQNNWLAVDGKNWLATLGTTECSAILSTQTADAALDAVRGIAYDADGIEKPVKLAYDYGVTAPKSNAWKGAHFGWNVVNSGSIRTKEVTFSDTNISAVQYLTADSSYTTVLKNSTGNTAAFTLAPYTAYFVQATGATTTTNGLLRSSEHTIVNSAVLELVAEDGTVYDRILATAGEALPGRNVEKLGIGPRSLYIDKGGMKCAATAEKGHFDVKVAKANDANHLRLVSLTSGTSATWNGVAIHVGETFAATNGTLLLNGTPTSTENPVLSSLLAWGTRGHIVIECAETGLSYRIVSTAGRHIASGIITDNRTTIPVGTPGIYFLTAGEKTVKVIVK